MADYPRMTSQPYGPFGLGGVNPQQQNMAGGNPYMRAPTAADQGGPNGGGQGGAISLGQAHAQGVAVAPLHAANGGAPRAQKQALAMALMNATQGHDPNVGAVKPLGSLPPGILQGV